MLLPTEKLNRRNYASWSYKRHQYLLRHGYWTYVGKANDAMPETTHRDLLAWEQAASTIMYYFAFSVTKHLLGHIREAKTSKESRTNLKRLFTAGTTTRKLQLRQDLSNVLRKDGQLHSLNEGVGGLKAMPEIGKESPR